jgi:hypothetical protein
MIKGFAHKKRKYGIAFQKLKKIILKRVSFKVITHKFIRKKQKCI